MARHIRAVLPALIMAVALMTAGTPAQAARLATPTLTATTTAALCGGDWVLTVAGTADSAPTGTITLTGEDGSPFGEATIDGGGAARIPTGPAGAYYNVTATYSGDDLYASATLTLPVLQAWPTPSGAEASLSRSALTQGEPATVTIAPYGDAGKHPSTGLWHLLAVQGEGDPVEIATHQYDGSGPFSLDLTEWAAARLGVWKLRFVYDGNAWVNGSALDFADLTISAPVVDPPGPRPPVRVRPRITGKVVGLRHAVRVRATVHAAAVVGGVVRILDNGHQVRVVTLKPSGVVRLTLRHLKSGRHRIVLSYKGSRTILPGTARWSVRVR